MSEERELRAVLEETQGRLARAEGRLEAVERGKALAEQRARELELMATAEKERIATLEEQLRLGKPDIAGEALTQMRARLATLELRLTQTETVSPRPPPGGVCSRCGSAKVVLARIETTSERSPAIQVSFDRDPAAAFFKEPAISSISAAVCGACGYLELSAVSAHQLWDAFERSRKHE